MFEIKFSPEALFDIAKLKRSEPACIKKLDRLINELKEHPTIGTGHPEQLKGASVPLWSRHITKKHRLVYMIQEEQIQVIIISAYGHYDDK